MSAESEASGFDPNRIIYHAEGLLAYDKPAGIPVHRGTGHDVGVVEALKTWVSVNPRMIDSSHGKKIHPLNLLEKDTSGVLLLGLSPKVTRDVRASAESLPRQFLAIVAGQLLEAGTIEGKVRSRVSGRFQWVSAEIEFERLRADDRLNLVRVVPKTSRAHQIRSLFGNAGTPLGGDLDYGKKAPAKKFRERYDVDHYLLHAHRLTVPRRALGQALEFEVPPPESFLRVVREKGWEDALNPGEKSNESETASES
ncbi:MAG: pseudouridine synthase [Planctomycetota bacterium]